MSEYVYIDSGSDTQVATDSINAIHYQKIKITAGQENSSEMIPGSASHGLYTDVRRLPEGDNVLGRVKITDGTRVASVDSSNRLQVSIGSWSSAGPLPAGTNSIGSVNLTRVEARPDTIINPIRCLAIGASDLNGVWRFIQVDPQRNLLVSDTETQDQLFQVKEAIENISIQGINYEEGEIAVVPTGTVFMWRKDDDDSIVSVTETNPLPVSFEGGIDIQIENVGVTGNVGITGGSITVDNTDPISVSLGETILNVTGEVSVSSVYNNPSNFINGTANAIDTNNATIISAKGAGVRIFITSIIIANSSEEDVLVNIKDGTTTKLVYPCPSKIGAVHTLKIPLVLSENAPLRFSSSSAVSTIYVSALGYTDAEE